jgi:hypothetical protein
MIANRDYQASRAARAPQRQSGDNPYELAVVCLSSVLGVAVTAFVIWLALGGTF